MKQFELIDHTADTGLVACGDTLAQAFGNAALGLFSIISDLSEVNESEIRLLDVHAPDIESLLVDWLNELIFIFDVDHLIIKRCDVRELTDNRLKATCYGEKYDPVRHHLKTGVKSATYHMLEVNRRENRVRVIFDV